jgi:hypothetical protein
MHYQNYKKIIIILFVVILSIVLSYFIIFGRALKQNENHLGIVFTLPEVIITSEAVNIDDKTYLAKNRDSFIKTMKQQGFTFVDQMGSGYFFEKNGNRYISTSRMYSSHFMVFTYPK